MPKTELKPTTREERERWKASLAAQPKPKLMAADFALRLIADVERLEGEKARIADNALRVLMTPCPTCKQGAFPYEEAKEALNAD